MLVSYTSFILGSLAGAKFGEVHYLNVTLTCPWIPLDMTVASNEVTLDLYYNLIGWWHNKVVLVKEAFHLNEILAVHDTEKAS
jgi:hypothetical protein